MQHFVLYRFALSISANEQLLRLFSSNMATETDRRKIEVKNGTAQILNNPKLCQKYIAGLWVDLKLATPPGYAKEAGFNTNGLKAVCESCCQQAK